MAMVNYNKVRALGMTPAEAERAYKVCMKCLHRGFQPMQETIYGGGERFINRFASELKDYCNDTGDTWFEKLSIQEQWFILASKILIEGRKMNWSWRFVRNQLQTTAMVYCGWEEVR